ncbi:hypothetical protein CcCBS67573_g05097 [Chytriomyces confervae]|uniref:RING-type domain-containing protein n=1 Tax=Chytriomyces confervae TaxID=246404 RepID=A0A507FBA7_9FUNG|nr:hypothetical protein CcCBS67573_g05097 [Chytriomyces confervae]
MSESNSSNASRLQGPTTASVRQSVDQRINSSQYSGYLMDDEDEEMMHESDLEYSQGDAYDDEDEDEEDEFEEEEEGESGSDEAAANTQTVSAPGIPAADAKSKEQAEQYQVDLRKQIVLIQQDLEITAQEKAKKIQELMTSKWTLREKGKSTRASLASNRLADKRHDFNLVHQSDRQLTFHDQASGVVGCKHYQRSAKLQAHCCGKWYTCRFCHDEVSDHNIISHDCGICRIGKGLGQDYFHCKTCNVCMAISLKGRHKCIERNLESDCPICGEYMFTSTTTVIFMPCGHCIHFKCHQEYIQTSYQCPTCFKSLANMTEYFKRIEAMLSHHQMPPEYSKTQTYIYCNDCEKKCYAKFHFLYHKCVHCKGYNTKVLQTSEVTDGTTVEANNAKLFPGVVAPAIETKEAVHVPPCCQAQPTVTSTVSVNRTSSSSSSSSSTSSAQTSSAQTISDLTASEPLFPNSSSSLHFSSAALSSLISFGSHEQPSENAQVTLQSHYFQQHTHAAHRNHAYNPMPLPQHPNQRQQPQRQHQHPITTSHSRGSNQHSPSSLPGLPNNATSNSRNHGPGTFAASNTRASNGYGRPQ